MKPKNAYVTKKGRNLTSSTQLAKVKKLQILGGLPNEL